MRWKFSTIATLTACAALLIWRHVPLRATQDYNAANREVLDRLARPVSLTISDQPLTAALSQLSEAAGVSIDIDPTLAKDHAEKLKAHVTWGPWNRDFGVTLRALLRQADLELASVVYHGHVVVVEQRKLDNTTYHVGQVHSIPVAAVGARGIDPDRLKATIESAFAADTWESSGGEGAIRALPGAIAVSHRPEIQQQIDQLIEVLVQLERYPSVTEPIPVDRLDGASVVSLRTNLDRRIDFHLQNATLRIAIDRLSQLSGIPIVCDVRSLSELQLDLNDPIADQDLDDVSVCSVLQCLLRPNYLKSCVDGDVVYVTSALSDEPLNLVVYPVADLQAQAIDEISLNQLIETIIEPERRVGRNGVNSLTRCGQGLIVSAPFQIQEELTDLLTRLRHALSRIDVNPVITDELPKSRTQERLAQNVKLAAEDVPLQQILDELSNQAKLDFVIDVDSLEGLRNEATLPGHVTIKADNESLETVLHRLLQPLHLACDVWGDVVAITTIEKATSNGQSTRLYDVRALLDNAESSQRLIDLICGTIAPNSWGESEGDRKLAIAGNILCVRQSEAIHSLLGRFLDTLVSVPDASDDSLLVGEAMALNTDLVWQDTNDASATKWVQVYRLGSINDDAPNEASPFYQHADERWEHVIQSICVPTAWGRNKGDNIFEFVVADQAVLVIEQTQPMQRLVNDFMLAARIIREEIANTDDGGPRWRDDPLTPSGSGRKRRVVRRSLADDLSTLRRFRNECFQGPMPDVDIEFQLRECLEHNLRNKTRGGAVYVWNGYLAAVCDDAAEADEFRHSAGSLLATVKELAERSKVETPRTTVDESLVEVMASDPDPIRQQAAALLLRQCDDIRRPLSPRSFELISARAESISDRLVWKAICELATASGKHASPLARTLARALRRAISQSASLDVGLLFQSLQALGAAAVPELLPLAKQNGTEFERTAYQALVHVAEDDRGSIEWILERMLEEHTEEAIFTARFDLLTRIDPLFRHTRVKMEEWSRRVDPEFEKRFIPFRKSLENLYGDTFD